MKKITLIIENTQIGFQIEGTINFPDVVQACMTAINGAADKVLKEIPKQQQQDAREDMADMLNTATTFVMDKICPPNEDDQLTEVAILKAENEMILEAAARKVSLSQVLREHKENAEQDRLNLIHAR